MDDSPSDADSLSGLLSPYPFQVPDTEPRPLPDPMAIRLVPVPNWLPPYDDELPAVQPDTNHASQIWATGIHAQPPVMAHTNDELRAGQYEAPDRDGSSPGGSGRQAGGQRAEEGRRPDGGAAEPGDAGDGAAGHGDARDGAAGHGDAGGSAAEAGDAGHGDARDGDAGDGVGQWPSQFAQVLAETLAGARPASQLTPWTNERARAHIRRLGPLLAVDRRPRVQRVRTSQPARDVVEVAVVAEFGSRTRALAARLERTGPRPATPGRPGREARWLCTAIESA